MNTTATGSRIALKNILYLTDFSEPSSAALPFAIAVAREYGATIHALHVLVPSPYLYTTPELVIPTMDAQEEAAQLEMQAVDAQFSGVSHDVTVVRGAAVWPPVWEAVESCAADLIVMGTHGRTGAQKLLLGSVAEEIFRRSQVPVLTIGPYVKNGLHNGGRFHRVLLATDCSPESLTAMPYAVSFAEENQGHLMLIRVLPNPASETPQGGKPVNEASVANAIHGMNQLVPEDQRLTDRPQAIIEFGDPATLILEVARRQSADLIVLGLRPTSHLGAATHLETALAHRVVAKATCAVLTVRS